MKTIVLALSLLSASVALHAATPPAPQAQLSQFKLGAHITGPQVALDNAAGKAVLIEKWGIHCPPCLASLPHIEKIAKRNRDKMLVFGAHSQGGTDAEVGAVVKQHGLSYTITQGVSSPVQTRGIPHVFLFDTKGALVFSGHPADPEMERAVRKATTAATGTGGARPSGLDALKRPGT
jgi:thiol-disulfide isomerase/thioredoxin